MTFVIVKPLLKMSKLQDNVWTYLIECFLGKNLDEENIRHFLKLTRSIYIYTEFWASQVVELHIAGFLWMGTPSVICKHF